MANGIASADMVIALGKAGCMGSYGCGGLPLETAAEQIDKIQQALGDRPYMVNMLATRNSDREMDLARLLVDKQVPVVEASAYILPSEALVYYRVKGLRQAADGTITIPHKIIAKVSRQEVMEKFLCPPAPATVETLLHKNLITAEEAALSAKIPMAEDITVEADSGGHTDGRPLVSLLPALIAFANEKQKAYGYQKKIRVGAAGGIGTGASCLAAFEMGAAYVVTGSVNQSCVEAGTSDYVKQLLTQTAMADITMAPCADQFEQGTKVAVMPNKTLYAQNARRLYDDYTRYASWEDIPPSERERIEKKILKSTFAQVWADTRDYFSRTDPGQLLQAEQSPQKKMALVFRWYLGQSSRWAIQGREDRKFDMQIWCGQSMGAFNLWVKGTPFERAENRHVAEVASLLLHSCAYHAMKNLLLRMGVSPDTFSQDILSPQE